MSTRKIGDFNLKSIGALPLMASGEIAPTADRLLVWDASASEGSRTKAIHVSQLAQLVASLNNNLAGLTIEVMFTQADLSVAGVLPVTHGLNSYPSAIALYTPDQMAIEPDRIEVVSLNAIAVDLGSFTPIQGTLILSLTS